MSESITYSCRMCGRPGTVELEPTGELLLDGVLRRIGKTLTHDACYDGKLSADRAQQRLELLHQKTSQWDKLCPSEFRKPLRKLSAKKKALLDRITGWTFCERGIYIVGPSENCKTRFAWVLLKREFLFGKNIVAVTHTEFRQTATALLSESQRSAVSWIAALTKADILFFDDLGKGNTTPASEEAFHDLIDARYKHNRPTIFTSELRPEEACSRFSSGRATAITRRIVESVEVIEV